MGKPNRSWLIATGKIKVKPRKRTVTQQCSDCRYYFEIQRADLRHAARPRCPNCGGPLNRPRQA